MEKKKFTWGLLEALRALREGAPKQDIRVLIRTKESGFAVPSAHVSLKQRDLALEAIGKAGVDPSLLRQYNVAPTQVYANVPGFAARATAEALDRLSDQPAVEFIDIDRVYKLLLNDVTTIIGVQAAWQINCDGSGVTVAVIDSGIDYNHPDLAGRVNLTESCNFTQEGATSDPLDRNGHGTHVAGIIGGNGGASSGMYKGIAPGVILLALKVFDSSGTGYASDIVAAVDWSITRGVDVINFSGGYSPWNPPSQMIRPPWIWPEPPTFEEDMFNAAVLRGIPTVVAAGNDGDLNPPEATIGLPATAHRVITVGSVTKQKKPSSFSSHGPVYRSNFIAPGDVKGLHSLPANAPKIELKKPDLVAPGGEFDVLEYRQGNCPYPEGIASARSDTAELTLQKCTLNPPYAKYTRSSGTSMAAPAVAGVCALILHRGRELGIRWGLQKAVIIKNLLMHTALKLGLPYEVQGMGMINWPEIERRLDMISRDPSCLRDYEEER